MKFLFTTLPTNDLGLLTRSLPVAKALSELNHTVEFASAGAAPRKLVEKAKFKNHHIFHPLYELSFESYRLRSFLKFSSTPEFKEHYGSIFNFIRKTFQTIPLCFAPGTNEVYDINHAFAITGFLNYRFVKSQTDAFIKLIQKCNPDAVVDFWNPFASMAARIVRKPLITINQGDALPGSKGFVWWKEKPKDIPEVLPVINRTLLSYGQPPINSIEELNRGDLTLATGIPHTDPISTNENFQHVGALIWQNPNEEIPDWLTNLPNDKPVIWIYPGNPSYGGKSAIFDSVSMLHSCMKAFDQTEYRIILSMGFHHLPEEFKTLPLNFTLAEYVPGIAMAQRADLLIHHGGYGSCQTGLITGTPSLILPTFSERESNARRIYALGAGDFVLPELKGENEKFFDSNVILSKTKALLQEYAFRSNAAEIGNLLKNTGNSNLTAKIIVDYLSKSKLINSVKLL